MSQKKHLNKQEEISLISLFLQHFKSGELCVHPTDTLPGLTCDPRHLEALSHLAKIKSRSKTQSYVGLVSSLEQARQSMWQALPSSWSEKIERLWPGPITIVWKAQTGLPSCLVSEQGEVALRNPALQEKDRWLYKVIEALAMPLPSTSINLAKETPLISTTEIQNFCQTHRIWCPPIDVTSENIAPSTIIRIIDAERFECLREGALSKTQLIKLLDKNRD